MKAIDFICALITVVLPGLLGLFLIVGIAEFLKWAQP